MINLTTITGIMPRSVLLAVASHLAHECRGSPDGGHGCCGGTAAVGRRVRRMPCPMMCDTSAPLDPHTASGWLVPLAAAAPHSA